MDEVDERRCGSNDHDFGGRLICTCLVCARGRLRDTLLVDEEYVMGTYEIHRNAQNWFDARVLWLRELKSAVGQGKWHRYHGDISTHLHLLS